MGKELEKEILLRLKGNLMDVMEISESKITKNSIFKDDLNMGSLDKYEFGFKLEEEFDMRIPDGDMQTVETVQDYIDYILAHKYHKK